MHTLLKQTLGIAVGVLVFGVGCLVSGYYLSSVLIPAWPPDYHATAAIGLMAVVLIVGTGVVATRSR